MQYSMPKLFPKEGESRRNYLVRVAIAYIENHSDQSGCLFYDETDCDGYCLVEDLTNEFELD